MRVSKKKKVQVFLPPIVLMRGGGVRALQVTSPCGFVFQGRDLAPNCFPFFQGKSENNLIGHLAVWIWVPAILRSSLQKQAASTCSPQTHGMLQPHLLMGGCQEHFPRTTGEKVSQIPAGLLSRQSRGSSQGHSCPILPFASHPLIKDSSDLAFIQLQIHQTILTSNPN